MKDDKNFEERSDFSRLLTALSMLLMLAGTAWIVFAALGGCTPY